MGKKLFSVFLMGILFLGLGIFSTSPAFADLVGDTVHVKISDIDGSVFCELDVIVIDPGVEIPSDNCVGISIDLDGDSIWFEFPTLPDEIPVGEFLYEFSDLDWVDNPDGFITGVEIIAPTNIPLLPVIFDDHSITLENLEFILDCGGPLEECILEWHLDISTIHPVGGTVLSPDTVSLLVLETQNNAMWWLPAVVIAGAGLALFKIKKKN